MKSQTTLPSDDIKRDKTYTKAFQGDESLEIPEGGCREDGSRLFSVVPSDRTRGKGHNQKHRRLHLSVGKFFFYSVCD